MPCNSDHMQPGEFEIKNQLAAQSLVYLLEQLSMPIEIWIRNEANSIYSNDRRIIPMLCSMLKTLNEKQLEDIVYNAKSMRSRRLADFYEEHRKEDLEREKKELDMKRKKELMTSGLQKLTDDEIKALEIKFELKEIYQKR